MSDILIGRTMTVRRLDGRRIRRSVTSVHHADDGTVEFTLDDEEIDDVAPVAAQPAASARAARGDQPVRRPADPLYAAMGDPDYRW